MPLKADSSGRTYIQHPNGQLTHYIHTPCTPSHGNPRPTTILIQHGFARHSGFWTHWIPVLSLHYNVIRRELRGHGYSSYPHASTPTQPQNYAYDVPTIIDEIVDLLDQLGLQKVNFLGESTGGMLGEILAATHPERVSSLTVCSTPTHLPPQALALFAFGRQTWPAALRELGARGWAEELAKVPGTVPVSNEESLQKYLDEIGISDGEGLAQYAEFLSTLDARPFLEGIQCPTLILAPTESAAVKMEDMKRLKERLRESRLVCIEGGGHEIFVTRAEACQRALLGFLSDLETERSNEGGLNTKNNL